MASTINALTTGVGGIQTTGDTSGNISLQSNGSNVLNTTSSGVSVPGTLAVTGTSTFTGAMSANGGLAVTGTLTVNGASPGRSGADYATLSSGTPNITLTASSNQLQVITATAEGQTITLPDMTTCTKGTGFFTFYNTSSYAVGVKDAGGTVREYLYPSSTNSYASSPISAVALNIEDTSTANGVWHLQNPISAGSFSAANLVTTAFTLTQTGNSGLIPIPNNPTQFILYGMANTQANTPYIKLATLNTSTKTFTFGSQITLTAATASNGYNTMNLDWNGTDRGLLQVCSSGQLSSSGQTVNTDYYGFAIVAGTLYVSGNSRVGGGTGNNPSAVISGVFYTGADDCFIANSQWSGGAYKQITIAGFKVGLSGTTVSLTAATGSGFNYNNSSSNYYYMSPTSRSTFVVDDDGNVTKTYVNYNTATNTLTQGARTSQTTQISNVLIGAIGNYSFGNSQSFIVGTSSAAGKYVYGTYVYSVTNAGTASVTVTGQTYNLKSFPAKSYSAVTTGIQNNSIYATSSSSYNVLSNTGIVYNCDPSNTNFNFNQASITLPSGTNAFYSSSSTITCYSISATTSTTGNLTCNIVSPANPFVG